MRILAVESSAKAASVCITEDGKLLGEVFLNCGLTHSVSVMPSVEWLLDMTKLKISDIDRLAISEGPGSFTGLRIGMSVIKGLAWSLDIPCVAVSTLEAAAYGMSHTDGTVCAVMDARAGQVYNALFSARVGVMTRLTPDRAISCDDLLEELSGKENVVLAGDGAAMCGEYFGGRFSIAPEHLRYQRAAYVARLAETAEPISGRDLKPEYIRLPQAERERLEKIKKESR
ncbi:MAG: tRNA (adenosine(37)-N6)-threonylcarbamoyltransferase complex dimerization subunit type 1 TsaB [Oscillospiraceae bacterium]|nr:tRNA (adenosine(37)-N6)-threonylcarbamoyltransferase complex dimerization subunit type 1 TsaB [Oscillospiraceae bacterium]